MKKDTSDFNFCFSRTLVQDRTISLLFLVINISFLLSYG